MDLPPQYVNRSDSLRNQYNAPVTATNEASPAYGAMRLQTFVFTRGFFGTDYKVFSSPKALDNYKRYKQVGPGSGNFATAKQNQNLSIGLPLLISQKASGYTSTYIRLFSTVPAPKARGRLYDSSQDDRLIGIVNKYGFKKHAYFTMKIQHTKIIVLEHLRLPIIDFQVGCNRYRFVRQILEDCKRGDYMYELYLLGPDQVTLFNGLDKTGDIKKTNPLLDKKLLKSFAKAKKANVLQFESPHSIGALEHSPSSETFTSVKKMSTFTTFTSAMCQECNLEVEPQTAALIAVALVVQRIEDIRAMNRGRSNMAHMNSMNMNNNMNMSMMSSGVM